MTSLPTSLSNLNITTFNKIYPLLVQKYSTLIPDPNANTLDKINSIIDSLNSMGKLSNDVVDNWNKVMAWVMSDGLNTDVTNKINSMVADGTFDAIFQKDIVPSLGNLSDLTTLDKSNLVHALNEVDGIAKTNQTNIGTLANLNTSAKSDLVSALVEVDNLAKTNQANMTSTLKQLNTQSINVLYPPSPFTGAKGDGVTDDTQAIQSMINYISTHGGTLFFPAAVYCISSSLTFNSMSGFKVDGAKAGLQGSFANSHGAWLQWIGSTEDYLFKFNDCQHFEVSSIGFHGNGQKGDGILVTTDNNPTSTNIQFKGLWFYQPNIGIYLNNGNNSTESDQVTFDHIRMAEVGSNCFITYADNATSIIFKSCYTFTLQTSTAVHYDFRRGNIIKMISCAGGYGGDYVKVTDYTTIFKMEQSQCEQNSGYFLNAIGVNTNCSIILENNEGEKILFACSNRKIICEGNIWTVGFTVSGNGNDLQFKGETLRNSITRTISGTSNRLFDYDAQWNVQGANGYTTLPNGMIFQWGSIAAKDGDTINFSKTFPTNVFNVQVSPLNYGGWMAVVSTTPGNFKLGSQAGATSQSVYWSAIGN